MASADAFKAAHSVYYETNTSEIKDDVAQLVACAKSGSGPLNEQEALFLLWHHALCGEDAQAGLVDAGIVPACLAKLDNADASVVARTVAAGILATLAQSDVGAEAIAKSRLCSPVLHKCLDASGSHLGKHAMHVLAALASRDTSRTGLLRSAEQQLDWAAYAKLLGSAHDHGFVTSMAAYIKRMLRGKEDRRPQACEAGICEALLHALRRQKSEQCCGALAGCIEDMCGERSTWPRLVAAGAIRSLVDLLGPPPAVTVKHEQEQLNRRTSGQLMLPAAPHSASISRRPTLASISGTQKSARFKGGIPAERQAPGTESGTHEETASATGAPVPRLKSAARHKLKVLELTEAGNTDAPRSPANSVSTKGMLTHRPVGKQSSATSLLKKKSEAGRAHTPEGSTKPRPAATEPPRPQLEPLGSSSVALKWESNVSTATHAAVAGALYVLVQEPDYCRRISMRLAVPRMVAVLAKVMEAAAGAGKKGKKKGGLTLLPEQEALLVALTGCLKFLTLQDNTNSFRVAKLGATRHLITIADNGKGVLMRRNAQAVLTTLTLLEENRPALQEAKLPEELFVQVPMGLTSTEFEQLAIEFPDIAQLATCTSLSSTSVVHEPRA